MSRIGNYVVGGEEDGIFALMKMNNAMKEILQQKTLNILLWMKRRNVEQGSLMRRISNDKSK